MLFVIQITQSLFNNSFDFRFGVAPDHPEVKNVINTFTKVVDNKNVNFYGNISLGKDVSLSQLRDNYHVVLLVSFFS